MLNTKQLTKKRSTAVKILAGVIALLCLGVAYLYFFVIPYDTADQSGIFALILAYGHPLAWVFLAMTCLLGGVLNARAWAVRFAYLALATYSLFMYALLFA